MFTRGVPATFPFFVASTASVTNLPPPGAEARILQLRYSHTEFAFKQIRGQPILTRVAREQIRRPYLSDLLGIPTCCPATFMRLIAFPRRVLGSFLGAGLAQTALHSRYRPGVIRCFPHVRLQLFFHRRRTKGTAMR